MSDIIHWTYLPLAKPSNLSNDQILSAIRFAANEWNLCMKGLVELKEGSGELQIRISFDNKINKKTHPKRIGECRTYSKPRRWEISFDSREKWHVGGWRKLFGIGYDLQSCALHELGHVLALPHSTNVDFIMYSDYNDKKKLNSGEIKFYRDFFINNA
jgi:hypothetical protein